MNLFKKQIPLFIVFLFGIATLTTYYVPHKTSDYYTEWINKWENIVSAFALFLGMISLFYTHYKKIQRKVDGWGYSLFVYIGFLIMILAAYFSGGNLTYNNKTTWLGWAFTYIYNPLSATMFSILAFFIISTAYRSFRIKSFSAFLLFVAGFMVILGNMPLAEGWWDSLFGWTKTTISDVKNWIINVPAAAGKRGILIGVAIGGAVTSLKIIFGIERGYMGRD
ncbi:MAG: hypothetical protein ACP5IO_04200 [Elusimicrobiales bacterium]